MMKEIKSFYTEDRLNKGYKAETNDKPSASAQNNDIQSQYEYLLPPVEVISAYEEYHPGTLKQILLLAEKEQQYRHAYEETCLKVNERTVRLGQLCSLFLMVIISYVTLSLNKTNTLSALIFAFISFGGIFAISLLNYVRKNNRTLRQNYNFKNKNNKPYSNFKK